jgi:hypothetical protein
MNDYRGTSAIELMLAETGRHVAFPRERDFSASVRSRIENRTTAGRRVFWSWSPRAAFVLALALIAVITSGLVLFPDARRAIADFLGISGVEIRVQEKAPSVKPPATPSLELGEASSIAGAQGQVAFDILVPSAPELAEPRVFLDTTAFGGAVTFVYEPGPRLPETEETGVGLLLTQFEAGIEQDLIKKVAVPGSFVMPLRFGDQAYWIEGDPHTILYRDSDGNILPDRTRLAGNTLLWEKDGVSYRIESELDRAGALRIARSMD